MLTTFIDRYFAHHGSHSGYQMLARTMGGEYVWQPKRRHHLLSTIPDKYLYRYLPLHPNWYNRQSLEIEIEIFQNAVFRKPGIFHFLYGEHSYHWSSKLNKFFRQDQKTVASFHQIPSFFEQRREKFGHLRYLDAAVLVSSSQRDFFESMLSPQNVFVVPHGVDTEFFRPNGEKNIQKDTFCCLTVGSNYRDHELLTEVIQDINRSTKRSVTFVLVGEQRFSQQFSVIKNVRYLHGISDEELLQEYRKADLLLMPLQDTTANNAILEAMACGLPVVVTEIGGIRDYVDESFASIVPPHNSEAMVNSTVTLLSDFELRKSMRQLARKKAEEKFDWRIVAEQIRKLYDLLH